MMRVYFPRVPGWLKNKLIQNNKADKTSPEFWGCIEQQRCPHLEALMFHSWGESWSENEKENLGIECIEGHKKHHRWGLLAWWLGEKVKRPVSQVWSRFAVTRPSLYWCRLGGQVVIIEVAIKLNHAKPGQWWCQPWWYQGQWSSSSQSAPPHPSTSLSPRSLLEATVGKQPVSWSFHHITKNYHWLYKTTFMTILLNRGPAEQYPLSNSKTARSSKVRSGELLELLLFWVPWRRQGRPELICRWTTMT